MRQRPLYDPTLVIYVLCTIFIVHYCFKRIRKRLDFSLGGILTLGYRSDEQYSNEDNLEEPSPQFNNRGLDSSIIQCLPNIQYMKKENAGETECAVCLVDFEVGDMLRFLPNCTHSFHVACIDTWFKRHSNCPLCRSHVLYNVGDYPSHSVSVLTLLETHRREDVVRGTVGRGGGSHEYLQNITIPTGSISFP